jgi:hypothetical protein
MAVTSRGRGGIVDSERGPPLLRLARRVPLMTFRRLSGASVDAMALMGIIPNTGRDRCANKEGADRIGPPAARHDRPFWKQGV